VDISVTWGPGAANNAAPAAFYTAVDYVVNLFDNLFSNKATININVGYGSILTDGQTQSLGGAFGASYNYGQTIESYSKVAAALKAENAPGASTLPANMPFQPYGAGSALMIDSAEGKALGLVTPVRSSLDGSIGIASNSQMASWGGWDYSPTTPPTSSQFDLIDTIEHEFTEVMGRVSLDTGLIDQSIGGFDYSVMDLYRYSSPGALVYQAYDPDYSLYGPKTAYFSLDGGNTSLGTWNNQLNQGDLGDWDSSGPQSRDAFAEYGVPGVSLGMSSTDITLMEALGWKVNPSAVACYCRGTLLRTSHGQKRVENLKIGDQVMTASGTARPIKWIGRRSYGGRFIMGRRDILPICFKTGSLGENVPRRDLWVSPHHAMYFKDEGGLLIEAKDLVNGVSIMQVEQVDEVAYFHIELETHDVIIAEGALSESFVDDDCRGMFNNADEYRQRYPEAAYVPARYCAPRVDQGEALERIRRRIALRAGRTDAAEVPRIGALRGQVDDVDMGRIEGWTQAIDRPEVPVCLDLLVDGQLVAQTLANRYRRDLQEASLGSGCHGFEFLLPSGLDLSGCTVHVSRSIDGVLLQRLIMPCVGTRKPARR
jgi:hypothetical protein